jgi:hypothetical protein
MSDIEVRTRTIYIVAGLTATSVIISPEPDTTLVITHIRFYQGVIFTPGTVRLKNLDGSAPTVWFQGNADPAGVAGGDTGLWPCTYGEPGYVFESDGNAWDIMASGYVLAGISPLGPYPFQH